MKLRSLGIASDLALIDGGIVDRGDYLFVKSPKQPEFYWGNLLVFPSAPGPGDFERWQELFGTEFASSPLVKHQTFSWDTGDASAEVARFVKAGFEHEKTVVLIAKSVQPPPHLNAELEVREVRTEEQWHEVGELHIAARDPAHSEEAYRSFQVERIRGWQVRIGHGQGEWYGAYLHGRMVGTLGIFRTGNEVARFQVVVTHPDARRQGVCGTLVYQVAKSALARQDVESLVMLADSEYHAARIYESVGFEAAETFQGLCRWPKSHVQLAIPD